MENSDKALQSVKDNNRLLLILVLLAAFVIIVMLGYSLIQQTAGVTERGTANKEVLEGLKNSSRDTQYLICQIVTVVPEGVKPNAEVMKICKPVLDNPGQSQKADKDTEDKPQSNSGGNDNTVSQAPAPGGNSNSQSNLSTPPSNSGSKPKPGNNNSGGNGNAGGENPPPAEDNPSIINRTTDGVCKLVSPLLLNECIIKL